MKDFNAPAQRLGKRWRADRHHHEFLEVDVVVGVRSTVQNVHHRSRQSVRTRAAQIAIERDVEARCRSARSGHRDCQDRIRAQAPLVLGTIEFNHLGIEPTLVKPVPIRQSVRNLPIDVFNRLENSFAYEAVRVIIAQFDRLVLAGGRAAGHNRPAHRSVRQKNFRFYRRIAA
jgi:hypothetical protein